MDDKVKKLADKIYQEGIQKASAEANAILEKANQERNKILADAKAEADAIKEQTQREIDAITENAHSEVRLASSQAIEALHTEIANMLTTKVVEGAVSNTFEKPDLIYSVVLKMAEKWAEHQNVEISSSDAEELEKYFSLHASQLLNKGVVINKVNGKQHTFELKPEDASYKVVIGKEAFIEYFKEFLRPKLQAYLFHSDNSR